MIYFVKTVAGDEVSTPEAQYKVYAATAIASSSCSALLLPKHKTQNHSENPLENHNATS